MVAGWPSCRKAGEALVDPGEQPALPARVAGRRRDRGRAVPHGPAAIARAQVLAGELRQGRGVLLGSKPLGDEPDPARPHHLDQHRGEAFVAGRDDAIEGIAGGGGGLLAAEAAHQLQRLAVRDRRRIGRRPGRGASRRRGRGRWRRLAAGGRRRLRGLAGGGRGLGRGGGERGSGFFHLAGPTAGAGQQRDGGEGGTGDCEQAPGHGTDPLAGSSDAANQGSAGAAPASVRAPSPGPELLDTLSTQVVGIPRARVKRALANHVTRGERVGLESPASRRNRVTARMRLVR